MLRLCDIGKARARSLLVDATVAAIALLFTATCRRRAKERSDLIRLLPP